MNDFYNTEYLSERVAALARERDDARREVRRLNEICERQARLNIVNAKLALDLDQVTAERDAAVADLKNIAEGGRTWMCSYCKHSKGVSFGFAKCELGVGECKMPYTRFEWRGVEGK